ncbi:MULTISPECIES: SDR family oxidoreductase [Croceibacter]|jgi:NAD(P)-dependent dehydrogenase (short-subunit alcohol dehydrogenase family)|uniref:2, 4-dienoyl-CoA reductase (NADPH) related protein n=1 Tax=Croceibacter atlanticus (strain ATCC BAA-628 / JCM 21780 / CIP 108009 / IAM 15332 / KCTC 12090 / HTCC2559) TaxID=216432 RepID=A3U8E6_CROAH|nr:MULTISPECIES: SDR family oxidoreductase [Croceibacter]HAT70506.1 KR domain-containing protein [Flavobacteriaceae bacterium]EAP88513.1 2, 4-dienoyl-CoA reductase (NADPH) precursor related protein [Croceibacter atlanticus HTCC2559]MAM22313.1 short-chain dehydrogenase [Croceibacter sp.]MBG26632.1 short-chain dehydrogenase [Croceibacter sp.]MBW4969354.1 SDR family oxidoreductase [Croceibacter atlanticus]|tara:strand:- start:530 stop:1414 length:885 start_codon:yes stop_codon:yes gene_type:complete
MNYTNGMLRDDALKGKNIVVTGGGSGLGKAMTTYFLKLGAQVAITSRNIDKLETVAKELTEETGSKCVPLQCDVRHIEEVEAMRDAAIKALGPIDVLLNNAAGNFISPTERLSANAFDTIIDIVLKGTKNCTLAFGKHWIDNNEKDKSVLNIVTTYAWTGSAYVVPSASAKAGVLAMTRSLAVEWAKYGMRFNAIAPGPFPTKGAWDRLLPGELKEKFDLAKTNPLKRVGDHQELANLAAYLVSDFSSYVNGEVITIDGGEWIKGAGQFNQLEEVPQQMWDMLEAMIRSKKNKS